MSVGNLETIGERCQSSPIGKKLPNSLWVHVSAIEALDPLLRLYEGCASRTIGRPEEATVVKFHFRKPKIKKGRWHSLTVSLIKKNTSIATPLSVEPFELLPKLQRKRRSHARSIIRKLQAALRQLPFEHRH